MMAVDLEQEDVDDQHYSPPRSVRDALRQYPKWSNWKPPSAWPVESCTYRWKGGNSTAGSEDGGMAHRMDMIGRAFATYAWYLEMRSAMLLLPADLLTVIRDMYEVGGRESPRTDRVVSERLKLSRMEVIKRLERAYGWLSRDLGIPPI